MDSKKSNWNEMINQIRNLSGPVWLSFDIDGLDGFLVPATGTPIPGGLSFWGANEIIKNYLVLKIQKLSGQMLMKFRLLQTQI